jgi:signal transduction histidine kinase
MARASLTGVRAWFRPPRNLLVFFILIVGVPAVALIGLGLRFLEQDRALSQQRQAELLDRAADQAVRLLEQTLAAQRTLLETSGCPAADAQEDWVCVVFRADRIEAVPPNRIPYYPLTQKLKEAPSEPFEELESLEFRQPQPDFDRALEMSRALAGSRDPAIRAGALLRQGRIQRKMGKVSAALATYTRLSDVRSASILAEPADLVGRRTRAAILAEQSRLSELREEAELLAADLTGGKWQLDRVTWNHVNGVLDAWLKRPPKAVADERLASALEWLYEKRLAEPFVSTGVHVLNASDAPVTMLWSFGGTEDRAFIAGARYLESRWLAKLDNLTTPARVLVAPAALPAAGEYRRVQRSAADTGLPWTLVVAAGEAQPDLPEFAARRRNLAASLGTLLLLIGAGSYFTWRAVNRELGVARLQSDFVSAVSHEFRTPLTALRQFNELLEDEDGPTAAQRRRYYQAQTRATERLHRLVESLLDFGRMEAGRRPYQFTQVDAAALAHDVTAEFLSENTGRGFEVRCTSDPAPHPVSADSDALSRAIWNLLDNAVKYSGDSRTVELRVSRSNGSVAIAVLDHGIGIPASERTAVFQKFVRGTAAMSGGIRGTGLGLAMVAQIVEAHSGTLALQSIEGQGSTFTIVLPAGD